MKLITVTPAVLEVVSIDEAREQLSLLDDTSHDGRILRLIKAATRQAEAHTGCRPLTQTVRLELDGFPSGAIDLSVYPVASVTTVAYDDDAGVAQTLTVDVDYYADLGGMTPRLLPVDAWPATKSGKPGSVRITFVAGWASVDLVPEDFAQAVLLRMSELFENTSESSTLSLSPVSVGFEALLAPHRRLAV